MEGLNTFVSYTIEFLKENPEILTGIVALVVVSFLVSVVKKLAKWAVFLWLVTIVSSAYFGYDIWEEIQILNSIKETYQSENVKIEEMDGDTVKAVVDGVTHIIKITDGSISELIDSKNQGGK